MRGGGNTNSMVGKKIACIGTVCVSIFPDFAAGYQCFEDVYLKDAGERGKRIFRIFPPPALGCPHKKKLKIKGEEKLFLIPSIKGKQPEAPVVETAVGYIFFFVFF